MELFSLNIAIKFEENLKIYKLTNTYNTIRKYISKGENMLISERDRTIINKILNRFHWHSIHSLVVVSALAYS